jgi:predicted nucleotidyltransferase
MISFKSKITQKILGFYFLNPHESLYVNELSRRLTLDKRNLVKKLREFELAGLLISEKKGNLRLYSVSQKFPLYKEYERIVLKTIGVEEKLKQILKAVPGIKEAYLYGSYAQEKMNAHSDLDLLVIGNHKIVFLQKKLTPLQNEIGREVNSVNMSEEEFWRRKEEKDPFLSGVFNQKTIKLI